MSAAYFGAFYATHTAFGYDTRCGVTGNPPCNTGDARYWVLQKSDRNHSVYSNGIRGGIASQDISMLDPATTNIAECERIGQPGGPGCDHITDALQVVSGSGIQFMTIGFTEGLMPYPPPNNQIRTSPKFFTEVQNAGYCPGGSYQFFERSTPSLAEFAGLKWTGSTGTCSGHTVWIWYFLRGSGYAAFDVAFIDSSYADFRAFTEHFDNSQMEPNGVKCFGRIDGCGFDPVHELNTYYRPTNTWSPWTTSQTAIIIDNATQGSGYFYNPINQPRAFFSGGYW